MQEAQKLERAEAGRSCLIDSISQRITVRSAIRISRFFSLRNKGFVCSLHEHARSMVYTNYQHTIQLFSNATACIKSVIESSYQNHAPPPRKIIIII